MISLSSTICTWLEKGDGGSGVPESADNGLILPLVLCVVDVALLAEEWVVLGGNSSRDGVVLQEEAEPPSVLGNGAASRLSTSSDRTAVVLVSVKDICSTERDNNEEWS